MPSAVQKVLAIPELLEQILVFVLDSTPMSRCQRDVFVPPRFYDIYDIAPLVGLQRVSRAFQDVLVATPHLLRILSLETSSHPPSPSLSCTQILSTLLHGHIEYTVNSLWTSIFATCSCYYKHLIIHNLPLHLPLPLLRHLAEQYVVLWCEERAILVSKDQLDDDHRAWASDMGIVAPTVRQAKVIAQRSADAALTWTWDVWMWVQMAFCGWRLEYILEAFDELDEVATFVVRQ